MSLINDVNRHPRTLSSTSSSSVFTGLSKYFLTIWHSSLAGWGMRCRSWWPLAVLRFLWFCPEVGPCVNKWRNLTEVFRQWLLSNHQDNTTGGHATPDCPAVQRRSKRPRNTTDQAATHSHYSAALSQTTGCLSSINIEIKIKIKIIPLLIHVIGHLTRNSVTLFRQSPRLAPDCGQTELAAWWATLLGDSGGVVNSLDFCPASLKSLGCFYIRCVLSSQSKAVTVNFRVLHCQF